ncbi:MAG: hypothetical protein FJW23_14005 [Acidimicrobiia bacterium]|nr:hypothetical protein [Acidimicrobiia bacterium]
MRSRLLLILLFGAGALGARMTAAPCDPEGPVRFICGLSAPEDLVPVPQSDWVVAGGFTGGGLYVISTKDHSVSQVFPGGPSRVRHDKTTYADCPGPLDTSGRMSAHGLNVRPGSGGVHTLYVVHHGGRESIEVFEIDGRARPPVVTWIGCAVVPGMQGINSVSPLPGGGFVVTNFAPRGGNAVAAALRKGENSGEVWEWQPANGWRVVPGSESPGPNGIEASRDGTWLYVSLWPVRKVMRLSRGRTPVQADVVDVPFHPDNIRWQADGSLLAAGHAASAPEKLMECFAKACPDATSNAARIDARTFAAREVVRLPFSPSFAGGTVALQVGNEVWLGAMRGDRVARYPLE